MDVNNPEHIGMMGFDPTCEKCVGDMEQDLILKTALCLFYIARENGPLVAMIFI